MTDEEIAKFEAEHEARKAELWKRLIEGIDDDALEALGDLIDIYQNNARMVREHENLRAVVLADMAKDLDALGQAVTAASEERGLYDEDEEEEEEDEGDEPEAKPE